MGDAYTEFCQQEESKSRLLRQEREQRHAHRMAILKIAAITLGVVVITAPWVISSNTTADPPATPAQVLVTGLVKDASWQSGSAYATNLYDRAQAIVEQQAKQDAELLRRLPEAEKDGLTETVRLLKQRLDQSRALKDAVEKGRP